MRTCRWTPRSRRVPAYGLGRRLGPRITAATRRARASIARSVARDRLCRRHRRAARSLGVANLPGRARGHSGGVAAASALTPLDPKAATFALAQIEAFLARYEHTEIAYAMVGAMQSKIPIPPAAEEFGYFTKNLPIQFARISATPSRV